MNPVEKRRCLNSFRVLSLPSVYKSIVRVIVYYERETNHPPSDLLPAIARALGISVDELLGLNAAKKKKATQGSLSPRLERRLQQIESLNTKNKRQLLQIIDTFIEREKLQKAAKE